MAEILLQHCGLQFPIYGTINRSLKGQLLAAATGGRVAADARRITMIEALQDVSLRIRPGDRVGLVGHNGAGKTSLLRLLAGIYEPTAGTISVHGKVTSLLDVTLGMDFEATGYENILIRGLMHGLSRAEIAALTPAIAEFSGLGDFLAVPVRTYSSGMLLRLAFSIVSSVHADILLMDEWLGVGDAEFSARAELRLQRMVDQASILVIASHNAQVIERLCNVIVRLEHGRIVEVNDLRMPSREVPALPGA